jgi:DNA-binding transcriptional LysR family regulator
VVLGFVTPVDHAFGRHGEARFSACAGMELVVPGEPLAVCQQVSVLEGSTGVVLNRRVSCDNIQMIASLVAQGIGIGILTSLDVITEVRNGDLSFIRISDPILRPMTLALCTASARMPSHAAGIVLAEIENSFHQLGFPASAGIDTTSEA